MEKILNNYLEKIEKYLKPLPVSERVDIVKEIKSEMLELQNEGKTSEEIIDRLGAPKELAKAYLGDLITKEKTISLTKVLAMIAYYSIASLSGIFVITELFTFGYKYETESMTGTYGYEIRVDSKTGECTVVEEGKDIVDFVE